MNNYQKELIKEHKELCERIRKINKLTINDNEAKDVHNYTNIILQQKGMMDYESALAARLCNSGICIEGDRYYPIYFEHITNEQLSSTTSPVEDTVSDNINKPIKETTGENDVAK